MAEYEGHRIGQAAQLTCISAPNIRFYEKSGLLKPAARTASTYRVYSAEDLQRLRFIRLCRGMDMSLDEIRALLTVNPQSGAGCQAALVALERRLQTVRERLAELSRLEKDLERLCGLCKPGGESCGAVQHLHAQAKAPCC